MALNREALRNEQLAFLNWEAIWFELERYKRDKAYYNIVFSPADLRKLLKSSWWYELFIPPGYLDFRGLDQRLLWQDIAVHLLKGYLDRFYQFHKREFEAPYLEYQVLRLADELVLKQYQLLVKKSERKLVEPRELAEKFQGGTVRGVQLRQAVDFPDLTPSVPANDSSEPQRGRERAGQDRADASQRGRFTSEPFSSFFHTSTLGGGGLACSMEIRWRRKCP